MPDDLRAALEWQGEQDLLCPGCHLPRDQTMRDPDEDPDAPRWQADVDVCHACAERSSAARAASEQNQGHGMDGWLWSISHRRNGQGA